MTDSARRQPPVDTTMPMSLVVFDAVCEALARTDLTMLKRLFGDLRVAIRLHDGAELHELGQPDKEAFQADIAEILTALRELVEQENAWPVMPT